MVRSGLIFAALFFPALAHAQYSNHGLGLGPHVTVVLGSRAVLWGVTLEFSNYLESGFELFGRVPLSIADVQLGADTASGAGKIFATGGSVGVRYLFLEGSVRPWVGLQLSAVVLITRPEVAWFLGTGTTLGLDWVLSESWSVGARAHYDVFLELNRPWRHQLGGSLVVLVLF